MKDIYLVLIFLIVVGLCAFIIFSAANSSRPCPPCPPIDRSKIILLSTDPDYYLVSDAPDKNGFVVIRGIKISEKKKEE